MKRKREGGKVGAAAEAAISSYDIIGDVAIIELPKDSKARPGDIAREIARTHPRIKTVLQKTGERSGEFRLRKFRKLLGGDTETVHREHGFKFRLDPTEVYFSPRESTERERIASMVMPGETVMVLFAGAGPFGVVIAGKQPGVKKVYQVEINPRGFEYMKQNIAMNKMSHKVVPILGDAREACKVYEGRFDRVVMPLPREGYRFLGPAMKCLKSKGFVHFYAVGRQGINPPGIKAGDGIFEENIERLEVAARKLGRRARVIGRRKALPYGPGAWKICIDAEVRAHRPAEGWPKKPVG